MPRQGHLLAAVGRIGVRRAEDGLHLGAKPHELRDMPAYRVEPYPLNRSRDAVWTCDGNSAAYLLFYLAGVPFCCGGRIGIAMEMRMARVSLRDKLRQRAKLVVLAELTGGPGFSFEPIEKFLKARQENPDAIPAGFDLAAITLPQSPGGVANIEPASVISRMQATGPAGRAGRRAARHLQGHERRRHRQLADELHGAAASRASWR